jgi:hypothetical protein
MTRISLQVPVTDNLALTVEMILLPCLVFPNSATGNVELGDTTANVARTIILSSQQIEPHPTPILVLEQWLPRSGLCFG